MSVEDKKAKIRSVLEELKSRSVSHETFRPYHEKVHTALQTIDAQIESIEEQHRRALSVLQEIEDDEQVKKALREQSFVPYRYHDAWVKVHDLHEQFVTWSGVAQHIARVAVEKYAEALSESRALDIERDAMKRFAEYQARQEAFHKEQVIDRLRVHEDKTARELDWFKREVVGSLAELFRDLHGGKAIPDDKVIKERFEEIEITPTPKVTVPDDTPSTITFDDEDMKPSSSSKARDKLNSLGFGDDEF